MRRSNAKNINRKYPVEKDLNQVSICIRSIVSIIIRFEYFGSSASHELLLSHQCPFINVNAIVTVILQIESMRKRAADTDFEIEKGSAANDRLRCVTITPHICSNVC